MFSFQTSDSTKEKNTPIFYEKLHRYAVDNLFFDQLSENQQIFLPDNFYKIPLFKEKIETKLRSIFILENHAKLVDTVVILLLEELAENHPEETDFTLQNLIRIALDSDDVSKIMLLWIKRKRIYVKYNFQPIDEFLEQKIPEFIVSNIPEPEQGIISTEKPLNVEGDLMNILKDIRYRGKSIFTKFEYTDNVFVSQQEIRHFWVKFMVNKICSFFKKFLTKEWIEDKKSFSDDPSGQLFVVKKILHYSQLDLSEKNELYHRIRRLYVIMDTLDDKIIDAVLEKKQEKKVEFYECFKDHPIYKYDFSEHGLVGFLASSIEMIATREDMAVLLYYRLIDRDLKDFSLRKRKQNINSILERFTSTMDRLRKATYLKYKKISSRQLLHEQREIANGFIVDLVLEPSTNDKDEKSNPELLIYKASLQKSLESVAQFQRNRNSLPLSTIPTSSSITQRLLRDYNGMGIFYVYSCEEEHLLDRKYPEVALYYKVILRKK